MTPHERMKEFAGESPGRGTSKLSCDDFNCNMVVMVEHQDGSYFKFSSAFIKKWQDWYFVFSEHNGYWCFHAGDIKDWDDVPSIRQLKGVQSIEIEELE